MTVGTNGNVGIGTNGSSYKLDVLGSVNAQSIYLQNTSIVAQISAQIAAEAGGGSFDTNTAYAMSGNFGVTGNLAVGGTITADALNLTTLTVGNVAYTNAPTLSNHVLTVNGSSNATAGPLLSVILTNANAFQPANATLTNLSGTGALTNAAALQPAAANLTNWALFSTNIYASRQGGSATLTNLSGTGALTNAPWTNAYQPASVTLTNIAGTGAITNLSQPILTTNLHNGTGVTNIALNIPLLAGKTVVFNCTNGLTLTNFVTETGNGTMAMRVTLMFIGCSNTPPVITTTHGIGYGVRVMTNDSRPLILSQTNDTTTIMDWIWLGTNGRVVNCKIF
jgi:hypothetical protein